MLGIALDGLGWGDDGTIWGGEFLLADYCGYERLASFAPVAMPGGASAIREPWRSLYAHLARNIGWAELHANSFGRSELCAALSAKPLATLDAMIALNLNSPPASSCGRLFDAVAAAIGICRQRQAYEGEAAMRLEAIVDEAALDDADGYSFEIAPAVPVFSRSNRADVACAAARSCRGHATAGHRGTLSQGTGRGDNRDGRGPLPSAARGFDTVALSGGCFQNRILFEADARRFAGARLHGADPRAGPDQ